VPILTRRPENVNNRTGEKAYLACEAYGIPTPHIAFRKVKRNKTLLTIRLDFISCLSQTLAY